MSNADDAAEIAEAIHHLRGEITPRLHVVQHELGRIARAIELHSLLAVGGSDASSKWPATMRQRYTARINELAADLLETDATPVPPSRAPAARKKMCKLCGMTDSSAYRRCAFCGDLLCVPCWGQTNCSICKDGHQLSNAKGSL